MASDNDFRALIRVEIDPSSIQSIDQQIKSIIGNVENKNHYVRINFQREGLNSMRNALNELEEQLNRMAKIRIQLGGSGARGGGGGGQDAITRTYNELLLLQERIKGTQVLLNNTRPNTDRYESLSRALHDLQQDYTVLRRVADGFFSSEQRGNLDANLQNAVQNATVLQETFNETSREFEKLTKLSSKLASLRTAVEKLDPNSEEFGVLSRELADVSEKYERLRQVAGQSLSSGQIERLNEELRETDLAVERIRARLQDQQNKADIAKSFGNLKALASDIANLQVAMERLNPKSEEYAVLKEQLDAVTTEYRELLAATEQDLSDEQIKQLAQRLEEAAKKVERLKARMADQREVKEYNASWKDLVATLNRMKSINNKRAGLDTRTDKNQLKELNEEYDRLRRHVTEVYSLIRDSMPVEHQEQFNRLVQEEADSYATLQARLQDTGGLLKGFINGFKESAANAVAYMFSGYRILTTITRAIKDAYNNVVEIDTAMTELKKVTDETDSAYSRFLSGAGERATQIGTTVSEYINSTADFARLGYDFVESQDLARVASIYAVVGDEIEGIDEASQSVISTMAAFNIQAGDAMSIIDKFNEVGNNFAISSGGIGEALTRSASALSAAGNTLDESIAMITAANRVVQDPQSIGTAFKTLTMRIRGAKTEMEEAGLDTEGMATSVSKLREQIQALSGVDIMIDDSTFKSTYQILKELSEVWNELEDVSRANITELIAGKRQGNIIAALMNDYGEAERVLETSINSANSAEREHEKWLNSIEAKTNQLKAAWQAFSKDFIGSEFVKSGISILTGVVSTADKLVNTLGGLSSLGVVVTLISIIRTMRMLNSEMNNGAEAVRLFGHTFNGLTKAGLSGIVTGVAAVVSVISALIQRAEIAKQQRLDEYASRIASAFNDISDTDRSMDMALDAFAKYGDMANLTEDEEKSLSAEILNAASAFDVQTQAMINGKVAAGKFAEALQELSAREALEQRRSARGGKSAAASTINEKISSDYSLSIALSMDNKLLRRQIAEAIPEEDFTESAESIVAYYDVLAERKRELLDLNLTETNEYKAISKEIDELSEDVSNYVNLLYDEAEANYILRNGMPQTIEEYKEMRDSIFEYVTDINGQKLDPTYLKTIGEDIKRLLDEDYAGLFDVGDILPPPEEISSEMSKIFADAANRMANNPEAVHQLQSSLNAWFSSLSPEDTELVYRIAISDDSSSRWGLDQWVIALSRAKETSDSASGSIELFYDELRDASEGSLTDTINKSQEYIESLEEIRDKVAGGLTRQDQLEVVAKFPELGSYINDTEKLDLAINKLISDSHQKVDDAFKQSIENVGGAATDAGEALQRYWDILKEVRELTGADYPNIAEERQIYSDVQGSYESGQKVGGMNSDEITKIADAFKDLHSYDPSVLFERTTHGVQLNTNALRTLNKEYEIATKSKYRETLNNLTQSYNDLAYQLTQTADAQERENISAQMADIKSLANEVANEAAQYDGLTASYKRWQEASSITDSRSEWEGMGAGLENVQKLVNSGWVNDNEVIAFMNMFLEDADEITRWSEAQEGTWASVQNTISRYFDGTTNSLQTFLNDASSVEGELFSIQQLADGSWDLDFEYGGEAELAQVLSDMYGVQLSAESVQYILEALSDSDFEMHIKADVDQPTEAIEETEEKIRNLQTLTERDWKGQKQDAILGIDTEGAISELETAIESATTTAEESDIKLPVVVDDEDLQDFLNGRYNDFKTSVEDPMYLNLEDTEAKSSLDQFKIVWDSLHDKTVHLSVARNEISAESYASGTAFAQGNWGTKKSGVALVGELGRKLFAPAHSDMRLVFI